MKPADFYVSHTGSSICTSITRGHTFKLFKHQCSLDVYGSIVLSTSGPLCEIFAPRPHSLPMGVPHVWK